MKSKIQILSALFALAIILLASGNLSAQRLTGNKNVITQERNVDAFTGIEAGGAFVIYVTTKDQTSVVVESDENLMDAIETKVQGGKLKISSSGIRNATKLNIYVTAPQINYINLSGAAKLQGNNSLQTEKMEIIASGASEIDVELNADELTVNASGASDVDLSGNAGHSNIIASGASNVKAKDLITQSADVNASGASNISVNATENVNTETSGASDVRIMGEPKISSEGKGTSTTKTVVVEEDGKYTRVTAAGINIEVIDDDSTVVTVGNKSLVVDEKGNVSYKKGKREKFNGHWAGFDIGVNGYVDDNFNIGMPAGYDFLELSYEKSIDVGINFFEQNFNLVNNKFGVVTGMGLRWNNYRFEDEQLVLVDDSAQIYGYTDLTTNWRKSKVVNNYLTVPLLLEYQTNPNSNINSFHFAAGMILGWRFRTWTKMMEKDDERNVTKDRETFHMNPFKYDVTARIGWGVLNLYGTYSLNTLFKSGEGPELYPFAMGLSISGW